MRGDELINLVGRKLTQEVEGVAGLLGMGIDEVVEVALIEYLIQVSQLDLPPSQWEDWEDRGREQRGLF